MNASVLIATCGRAHLLPEVLAPLLADPATSEAIVVDGCRDGSLEALASIAETQPKLKSIYVQRGGRARALLTGALQASSELLVIIDDDAIAAPDTVGGHVRHHANDPGRLLVAGYVESQRQTTRGLRELGGRLREFLRLLRGYRERRAGDSASHLARGYVSIRRADYLAVAGARGSVHAADGRSQSAGLRKLRDPSLRARRTAASVPS